MPLGGHAGGLELQAVDAPINLFAAHEFKTRLMRAWRLLELPKCCSQGGLQDGNAYMRWLSSYCGDFRRN